MLLNLSFQILTGDMEGIPVVTIKKHEIKKVCADKMFTALDRNKKLLSINDPVDVSEGPTEVKDLHYATLFVNPPSRTTHLVLKNGMLYLFCSNWSIKTII